MPIDSIDSKTKVLFQFEQYLPEEEGVKICNPDGSRQELTIRNLNTFGKCLEDARNALLKSTQTVSFYFSFSWKSKSTIEDRLAFFRTLPLAEELEFEIAPASKRELLIRLKPQRVVELGNGKQRKEYQTGVVEEFSEEEGRNDRWIGMRTLADGTIEEGIFFKDKACLAFGVKILPNGEHTFLSPLPLFKMKDESRGDSEEVLVIQGKLQVWRVVFEEGRFVYRPSDKSVEQLLIEGSRSLEGNHFGSSIEKVVTHPDFSSRLESFIAFLLSKDSQGVPQIFYCSAAALYDVLHLLADRKEWDPLSSRNPRTKHTLFTHLILKLKYSQFDRIKTILDRYPEGFKQFGKEMIEEKLRVSSYFHTISPLINEWIRVGGTLDPALSLKIQIASNQPVKQKDMLAELSEQQTQELYEIAYRFNNCSFYEPAKIKILPHQYSLNFMWINRSPSSKDQLYLVTDSLELEKKKLINPLVKWIQLHPQTPFNIWYDGAMTPLSSVQETQKLLIAELDPDLHSQITFRDVRSIPLVKENPDPFYADSPIYFRVDLLRAVAIDYCLGEKETSYAIYADIDMLPHPREQLFSRKSLDFLEKWGFVFAKGGHLGFENGFQIWNAQHAEALEAHRKVIVELSIKMAVERPSAIKEQQIYDTYPAMLTYLYATNPKIGTYFPDNWSLEKTRMLRFDRWGTKAHDELPVLDREGNRPSLRESMPKIPVRLPPSHF